MHINGSDIAGHGGESASTEGQSADALDKCDFGVTFKFRLNGAEALRPGPISFTHLEGDNLRTSG
jgi:hypothetical protein